MIFGAKYGMVQVMNKRILVGAAVVIFVAVGAWLVYRESAGDAGRPGGDVDGVQQTALHTLTILTVDGDTLEAAPNVMVFAEEQQSARSAGRALVQNSSRSNADGVVVFQLPQGNYVIRSGSPEWYGVLPVQLEQSAQLYMNLRSLTPTNS